MGEQNYVDNGKISSRQTFRLYVFDLMGIATLLLPPYLAKLCGESGVYAILLGILGGLIYLFVLGGAMKKMKKDMLSFLREDTSPFLRKLILVIVLFHSVVTAGFCAYVFANLMQYSLVKESSYFIILLLIVIVAAYAVSGGIESRARVYEVLFWFILLPFIGMMLVSMRDFEWVYVESILRPNGGNIWKGAYLVFLLQTPLFFALFLIGEKEKNYGRNIIKTITVSVLYAGSILLGSYILLLGNFGAKSLANLRFPVITLMSTIQFEGYFLKRMDALMLAVWFFTLYALLNLHLHYGVRMVAELGSNPQKLKWWQVILPSILVFIVAYSMHIETDGRWLFMKYYSNVAVPFMVIIPLLLFLTGCSTTELEERSFPMLVAVEYEDGNIRYRDAFPKEDDTGRLGAKEKDYNHLKVFVFEEDFLEHKGAYETLVTELSEKEKFPRNTYVCVIDDVEELFEMEREISQDLGTYVEEYLKTHEENKSRLLTLGDLIDEQANQTFVLYFPYLDVEENVLVWKGYVNTSGKNWKESD